MAERKSTGSKQTESQQQILEKLDALGTKVDTLSNAIVGDVKEIGLMERVRNLEQWVASEKKLIYIIVGVILTDIITRIWSLIAP